jgi:hypothetical protein
MKKDIDVAVEIWDIAKQYMIDHDRRDAAGEIICSLIDSSGFAAEDILDSGFQNDRQIKQALKDYFVDDYDLESDNDDEEEFEEYWEDE